MANLLSLSRAEQDYAKRLIVGRYLAHTVTFGLSVAALFVSDPLSYYLAAAALATELVANLARWTSAGAKARGDDGRRRSILIKNLGASLEGLDLADTRQRFSGYAHKHAPRFDDPNYWATEREPGPARLCEALQESLFYSRHLYRAAGSVAGGFAVLPGALFVVVLFVLLLGNTGDVGVAAARVAVVGLSFLLALDLAALAVGWYQAGIACERLDSRLECASFRESDVLLAVWGDYSAVHALASPIPERIYQRKRNGLEADWQARLAPNTQSR
jgi:hypothetical protein